LAEYDPLESIKAQNRNDDDHKHEQQKNSKQQSAINIESRCIYGVDRRRFGIPVKYNALRPVDDDESESEN